MRFLLALVALLTGSVAVGQITFKYEEGESYTHEECIRAYAYLADQYELASLKSMGLSDVGRNIHLFYIGDGDENKPALLINNAIHPGEPCGVQASIKLAEEILSQRPELLDHVNIAIIPMYNIGGALNRSCCTRANQDGPVEQGFRGNAQHLDLNRDFIKADSRNAAAFHKIFHKVKPALFVDTHTTNGADYPYNMTLIHSQLDMIDASLAAEHGEKLVPHMYTAMAKSGHAMGPYMDLIGQTPEEGIIDFPDWPRYSTGYAALFNCFGFTTEAHMLKPFQTRVEATFSFLDILTRYAAEHASEIKAAKANADKATMLESRLALDFELDTLQLDSFYFKGYEAIFETSKVTGLQRLRYDREQTWEKYIKHLRNYQPKDFVRIPEYYYLPQSAYEVVERMQANGIKMEPLAADMTVLLDVYYITDFETVDEPYEGHYLHSDVETQSEQMEVALHKGDFRISTQQPGLRYIVQTLEPRAADSFFAWGYFDAVLQQKEWFSPYVFEDIAEEVLANDAQLRQDFQTLREEDPDFAQNMWAQLIYVYRHSDYYEEEHKRYPVYRSIDAH